MKEPAVPKCPDCSQQMDAGFIPDIQTTKYVQNIWHPAPCDKTGTVLSLGLWKEHIKVDREMGIEIVAFRCPACGTVKLTAPTTN